MARKRPPADSQADTNGQQEPQQPTPAADAQAQAGQQGTGNVSPQPASRPPRVRYARVRERLMATPEWPKVKAVLAEMRADPKLAPLSAEAREQFIWAELDRLYPPPLTALLDSAKPSNGNDLQDSTTRNGGVDSGRVQGLGDLPPAWPALPANASLAAEIGWVQANRLYVVEELDRGGTRVHLDKAHEPAPSRAAIGWLETSIRSYAKYVEVAAKATGAGEAGALGHRGYSRAAG